MDAVDILISLLFCPLLYFMFFYMAARIWCCLALREHLEVDVEGYVLTKERRLNWPGAELRGCATIHRDVCNS
jgi:hypothetical protein